MGQWGHALQDTEVELKALALSVSAIGSHRSRNETPSGLGFEKTPTSSIRSKAEVGWESEPWSGSWMEMEVRALEKRLSGNNSEKGKSFRHSNDPLSVKLLL